MLELDLTFNLSILVSFTSLFLMVVLHLPFYNVEVFRPHWFCRVGMPQNLFAYHHYALFSFLAVDLCYFRVHTQINVSINDLNSCYEAPMESRY